MNNTQEKVNPNSFRINELRRLIIDQSFHTAKREVEYTTSSTNEIKELTANIMQDISNRQDPDLMVEVIKRVQRWKKAETPLWQKGLLSLANTYSNISAIYVNHERESTEFLLVVDDVLSDEVLQYNEFCFELMEDVPQISNFYIFDEEEYRGMHTEYADYNQFYLRG